MPAGNAHARITFQRSCVCVYARVRAFVSVYMRMCMCMCIDLQRELLQAPLARLERRLKLYHLLHGAHIRCLRGLGIVLAPELKILRIDLLFLFFHGGNLQQNGQSSSHPQPERMTPARLHHTQSKYLAGQTVDLL